MDLSLAWSFLLTKQGFTVMDNRCWMKAVTALVLAASLGMAQAQDTGVAGFFQRAGAAIKNGASTALGNGSTSSQTRNGQTTTTGPNYKPISPAGGGQFVGLFDHFHSGDTWPRAAVTFTSYGITEPCWTARATIWRSSAAHHEETFQVCNSPMMATDALGNTEALGDSFNIASGPLMQAQNIPGISHIQTANDRNTGPNPPMMLFSVDIRGPILFQYEAMVVRLAWISGYINHEQEAVNNMTGKALWVAGFDPSGNRDRH